MRKLLEVKTEKPFGLKCFKSSAQAEHSQETLKSRGRRGVPSNPNHPTIL